jgi:hypothetical protein
MFQEDSTEVMNQASVKCIRYERMKGSENQGIAQWMKNI